MRPGPERGEAHAGPVRDAGPVPDAGPGPGAAPNPDAAPGCHVASSINAADATAKLEVAFAKAVRLQLAGELALAEQLYTAILQAQPKHAIASYALGMLKVQARDAAAGLPHLLAALEAEPQNRDYWLGYLEGLLAADRGGEARETLTVARQRGLAGEAVENYARRLDEYDVEQRRRAALQREEEQTLEQLIESHQFDRAFTAAREMTARFPASGLAFKVLGAFLSAQGHLQQAQEPLETAVRLMPEDAESWVNLGLNLIKLSRLGEAEARLKRAIELEPQRASAHFRLAMAYGLRNHYTEAEASIRTGMALDHGHVPGDCELTLSAFLFIVSHNPTVSADELFAQHCRAGEMLEQPQRARWRKHRSGRDPARRLKIGFVSGDFYSHAVSTFVEPVLAVLETRRDLELHGYYHNNIEDAVNRRMRAHFAHFSKVLDLSDEQLAAKITADAIDILIDLSGHSSPNRLPALARKPAPIQVSWIGYPGTTGMQSMDYYVADRYFLPPGEFDRYFTEKLVYLPANVPFQPYAGAPEVNASPALETGVLTFASFNRLGKVNAPTLDLWAAVLNAVPDARFLVGAIDTDAQERMLVEELGARGIAAGRLSLHRRIGMVDYLRLHHHADICLDSFPYAGGTTTFHALWMGVPTLTIAGATPASRQGAAIVGQLGLTEFIAADAADLAAKARAWDHRRTELAELRATLRTRMQQSPGRHPDLIASSLASALRRMWARHCAGLAAESFEA